MLRDLLAGTQMVEPGPQKISTFPGQCSFQHLLLLKPGKHFPFNSECCEVLQFIYLNEAGSFTCIHMMIFVSELIYKLLKEVYTF